MRKYRFDEHKNKDSRFVTRISKQNIEKFLAFEENDSGKNKKVKACHALNKELVLNWIRIGLNSKLKNYKKEDIPDSDLIKIDGKKYLVNSGTYEDIANHILYGEAMNERTVEDIVGELVEEGIIVRKKKTLYYSNNNKWKPIVQLSFKNFNTKDCPEKYTVIREDMFPIGLKELKTIQGGFIETFQYINKISKQKNVLMMVFLWRILFLISQAVNDKASLYIYHTSEYLAKKDFVLKTLRISGRTVERYLKILTNMGILEVEANGQTYKIGEVRNLG